MNAFLSGCQVTGCFDNPVHPEHDNPCLCGPDNPERQAWVFAVNRNA